MSPSAQIYAQSVWHECAIVLTADRQRAVRKRLLQVSPRDLSRARPLLDQVGALLHPAAARQLSYSVERDTLEELQLDVEGTSLRTLAARGSLSLETFLGAIRDAARALQEIEARYRLHHGALRASKLRLAGDGTLRIVGFGIDRLLDDHLLTNGTLPPDLLIWRPETSGVDPKNLDGYALGRIIQDLGPKLRARNAGAFAPLLEWLKQQVAPTPGELLERVGAALGGSRSTPASPAPPPRGALDLGAMLAGLGADPEPQPRRPTALVREVDDQTFEASERSFSEHTQATTIGEADRNLTTTLNTPDQPLPEIPRPRPMADGEELIGRTVHGYVLEELLASGTYGHVYRGVHALLGHPRAIKVLRAQFSGVEAARRRLTREAEGLLSLRHENLVAVQDLAVLDDQRPIFVMELLLGQTLAQLLRIQGPLRPPQARELVRQIAQGLAALHHHGIVHRDLKPANLMLVRDGPRTVVKILDLGVARAISDGDSTRLTRAFEVLGTPSYMAPEQIESPSLAGPAADQYSLGIIWLTMLSGAPPFQGDPQDVMWRHRNAAPPIPPGPDAAMLTRMLAKKPEDRYPSIDSLLAILDPAPVTQEIGHPRQPSVTVRRGLSWVAVPLLVVGGVGIGLFLGRGVAPTQIVVVPSPSPPPQVVAESAPPSIKAAPLTATVATTIEPEPELEPIPSPRPRVTTEPRPRPRPSPSQIDGRAQALSWLRAHHLSAEDLRLLLPEATLSDPDLVQKLSTAGLDGAFLKRRADRIFSKLRELSSRMALDETRAFEDRYIAVRKRVTEATAGQVLEINAELDRLESEIDHARRG
ncbi:MAG: serine/threonine-protein kinase [Myxococcota bacterium]